MKLAYRVGMLAYIVLLLLSALSWGSQTCLALWEVSTTLDSSANLIVNGSFEIGSDPGPTYLPLNAGSTAITGWTVTRGQVDYVGIWQDFDGVRSVDLDGTPGFGGVAQTFATDPGVTYSVRFAMAGNSHGLPEPKTMAVEAAGQAAVFTYDATGTTYDSMAWQPKNWKFIATGSTTTLEFYSLDNIDGFYGPALDSVSVIPIPVAIDSSVLALWHFDEVSGSTLHDASIYHNDGHVHNTSWVPGIAGNALHFDGLTSYVTVPNSASLKPAKDFVVDAWFNLDTLDFDFMPPPDAGHGVILGNLGEYPSGGGYQLHVKTGAQFQFDYRVGNPISEFSGFTPITQAHRYYHIESFYLRRLLGPDTLTVLKTYLDGVLTDSVAYDKEIQYSDTPIFYIGTNIDGRPITGRGVREFPGVIDEITIRSLGSAPPVTPLPPATAFHTFSQSEYAERVRPLRAGHAPTAANVRDETFMQKGWFNSGLFVGIPRPDSTLFYGYFYFRKNLVRLNRFLPHTGSPRGFDFYIGTKPWHFSRANPAVKYHDNHLAGEQYILKFNVGASDVGITPAGFGDLLFSDPTQPSNPYNGMSIREIMAHTDSALTFCRRYTPAYFAELDSCLSMINSAFTGPITSYSTSPLTIGPARLLSEVPYLHSSPSARPVIHPEPIIQFDDETPSRYALYQNYPNPFNPMTSIDFDLKTTSIVTLRVYNTLGQLVGNILLGAALEEGRQTVEFDGSTLPSGVYFYRLEIMGEGVDGQYLTLVQKMVLMR